MSASHLPRIAATLLLSAVALGGLAARAEQAPRYDQISLQAQAQRDVVHDVMRVTLYSEMQDSDPAALAAKTTRALNAATTRARQVAGVTVQTGSRASTPVYGKDRSRRVVAWRERAELHLESADFAALAALVAQLQGDLQVSNQHFVISQTSRKTVEDSLMQEAIAAFRARAQLAVEAFGATGYRLVSLNLESAGFRPVWMRQRMVSAMMASADSAEPQQIEAGSSEVGVTASGVIEIQR